MSTPRRDPGSLAQFLATMGHELRTPMNGVLGMAELLNDTPLTLEQREYIDVLTSSARSLLRVVDDILDYPEIDSEHLTLESEPFFLHRCLGDTLRLLAPAARAKGIELVSYVDPALPESVRGDLARLRQVVSSLTAHAIKFTAAGRVVVDIRPSAKGPDGERLQIDGVVRDSGAGIPIEQRSSGLGLIISQRLLERMGGRLWVESLPGEGCASCFTLSLDVVAAHATLADAFRPPVAGRRAVVVDDRAAVREAMSLTLDRCGMTTAPDGDGFETTAAIRTREAGGNVRLPIVALTAQRDDRARCLAAGMNDYPSKPVVPAELAETLDGVMAAFGSHA